MSIPIYKILSKKIMEIGNATLRNYLNIIKSWFDYDLTKYNFYLMPISFFHEYEIIESYSINKYTTQQKLFIEHTNNIEKFHPSDPEK